MYSIKTFVNIIIVLAVGECHGLFYPCGSGQREAWTCVWRHWLSEAMYLVDYLRQYTWYKQLETWVKTSRYCVWSHCIITYCYIFNTIYIWIEMFPLLCMIFLVSCSLANKYFLTNILDICKVRSVSTGIILVHLIGQKFSRKKKMFLTRHTDCNLKSIPDIHGHWENLILLSKFHLWFSSHLKRSCEFSIELFLLLEDFGKQKNYSVVAL